MVLWVPRETACGRYLEGAFNKGLERGMMLTREQSTGDRPSRGGGRCLRTVRAGLGWSCEGPAMEFMRTWIQCLELVQQIRERATGSSCRVCVRHH